jgi:hypothetical protein
MSEQVPGGGAPAGKAGSLVARHPNASIALGSGSGLGALVVWLVGLTGTAMPPEVGAAVGGAVAAAVLFVGRRGVKGTIVGIWQGSEA